MVYRRAFRKKEGMMADMTPETRTELLAYIATRFEAPIRQKEVDIEAAQRDVDRWWKLIRLNMAAFALLDDASLAEVATLLRSVDPDPQSAPRKRTKKTAEAKTA